ncbi:hypothetical protein [Treponema sp.]|uniref:hypothetical protein n=1 Tax=Treponema sp. TaxID=166 RepID=UPI00388D14E9
MKKFLSAAFIFLISIGSASGKEKIFHSETRYFDIIFDESSKDSAMEIHDCADEFLERLCIQYKVEPDFKIPVVITSRTENYNAYFTNYNYNHIVLYDTVPDESMLEFSRTIRSTFLHELTHLVSTNARNGFWKRVGKILGDTYNPGYYITTTSFFKEGATVTQESREGEGRLNDGFFLHDLKQAKISNRFPGYTDSFGARSIYPVGSDAYLFGSTFTEYIIAKYGMDKYAEFWHRGTNSNRLTSTAVFKKTYGVSMKKEWKNFYESIAVDGIETDPTSLKGISKFDFKNRNLHLYSILGLKNGNPVVLDKTTNSVFIGKKKLFTNTRLLSAGLSGNYIVTTETDLNHLDGKVKASFFNIETSRWKTLDGNGIKSLCTVDNNGEEFIAFVSTHSQKSRLEIQGLGNDTRTIHAIDFGMDEIPYGLCQDNNGNLLFLLKEGLEFSICRASFTNEEIEISSFKLDGIKPRFLSACGSIDGKTTAVFSFVEGRSFPRLATAEINGDEMKLSLLNKDISGGIYSPVQREGKIIYAAKFYTEGALYELDLESFRSDISEVSIKGKIKETINSSTAENGIKDVGEFNFSEYRKLLYPRQTIVPLSSLQSYYISPSVYFTDEQDCLGEPTPYLLGITVIKSNPWDTRHAALTAGYSPLKNAGGAGMALMAKSSSGNLSFTDSANSIFDKDGFMQVNNSFTASLEMKFGNISRFIISESNFFLYGKDDMDKKTKDKYYLKEDQTKKNYIYDKNTISLLYSTIHRMGARTQQTGGIAAGINLKNVYATTDAEKKDSIFNRMLHYKNDSLQFSQFYPSIEVALPGILPIDCKGAFTYNLPVRSYVSLCQFNDTFLTGIAEAVLFSWEIQKGMGAIPLYVNTLTLKANYQEDFLTGLNRNMEIGNFSEDLQNIGEMLHDRYVGSSLILNFAGNTGALANPGINISLSCKVLHCLEGSNKGNTKILFNSMLNFSLF